MKRTIWLLTLLCCMAIAAAQEDFVVREDHVITIRIDNSTIKINGTNQTLIEAGLTPLDAVVTLEDRDSIFINNISVQNCNLDLLTERIGANNFTERLIARDENFTNNMVERVRQEIIDPLNENDYYKNQTQACQDAKDAQAATLNDCERQHGSDTERIKNLEKELEEANSNLNYAMVCIIIALIIIVAFCWVSFKDGW